jgi:hypothetical protein
MVRGRCQKITHSRSGLGSPKLFLRSQLPSSGFELSSRVASRQRSRDFTRNTLTALCVERTMLRLQVTQRVTREHLHGMIKPERQTESSDAEMSGEHLGTLLRQVSKTSIGEIESLIVELKTLHKKLQTDGDRIQRDIAEHAELSQQVMLLTKIIFDSVKKLPGRDV